MAKKQVKAQLKKGKSQFTIIGKAKINDYTYKIDTEYDSGWTENSLNLGIDCGNGNVVYTEMKGGYFPDNSDRESILYVHGTKENEDGQKQDDYDNRFTIDWEDRFDDSILETVGNNCFITVGIEKDAEKETFVKKFLSKYDAVSYIQEHLTDGMVVNVKGNIQYQPSTDLENTNTYVHKNVTSIFLSKIEDEDKFKAKFTQTILLDSNSIGKKDIEKNTIGISAYVVDYVGKVKVDDNKLPIKENVTMPFNFELEIRQDKPELTAKMLQKFFKVVKKTDVTELTVEGDIVEGRPIVNVTEEDIPADIKELIDMEIYSEDEYKNKYAVGNKNREKRMIITRPCISFVGTGEDRKSTVAIDKIKYKEIDKVYFAELLKKAMSNVESDNKNKVTEEEKETEDSNSDDGLDDELLAMLQEA